MSDINLTENFKKKMVSRPRVPGRYSASELYFILYGGKYQVTPEKWLHPPERTVEENMRMFDGIWTHNKIQSLLDPASCEKKKEIVYRDIVLVGKADYLPQGNPDQVWEFKTSAKKMAVMKDYHGHQTRLYTSMFEKQLGIVYQPVSDKNGIYLKHLGSVERNDAWFEGELRKLYIFHEKVETLRALEPTT